MGCTATKPMTSGGGAPLDVKLTEKVDGLAQSLDQKLDAAGKTVENGVAAATGSVKETVDSASNAVKEGTAQAAAAKESGNSLASKVESTIAKVASDVKEVVAGVEKLIHDNNVAKGLCLGDTFPNFEFEASMIGNAKLWDYFGSGWGVLFSHPADFTPVCTTELSTVAKYKPEFDKRNCKVIALSCDSVDSHNGWIKDIGSYEPAVGIAEKGLGYPIIADPKRDIAYRLGMMDAVSKDAAGLPLTARAVFICGPDKKLKLSMLYPATTGRNFDEIVRVLDSLQLTAERKLATPANWVAGNDCVVAPSVSTEEAKKMFPKGVKIMDLPSKKEYLRFTPDPREVASQ